MIIICKLQNNNNLIIKLIANKKQIKKLKNSGAEAIEGAIEKYLEMAGFRYESDYEKQICGDLTSHDILTAKDMPDAEDQDAYPTNPDGTKDYSVWNKSSWVYNRLSYIAIDLLEGEELLLTNRGNL